MSDPTIADDLKAARALVERGWHKGGLSNGHAVCAVGALNIVCNGSINARVDSWIRRDAAAEVLKNILSGNGYPAAEIAEFNDAPATTKQDVLNLFDKALAELGGLA